VAAKTSAQAFAAALELIWRIWRVGLFALDPARRSWHWQIPGRLLHSRPAARMQHWLVFLMRK
jgi:hypothetical protein